MNRIEFMTELAALLQDVPEEERRDAMKYYNDYFDDAGEENESQVVEELESPAKVAATIKADLESSSKEHGEFTEKGYSDSRFEHKEMPVGREDKENSYRYGSSQENNYRGHNYQDNSYQGGYGSGNYQGGYSNEEYQGHGYESAGQTPPRTNNVLKVFLIIMLVIVGLPIVLPVSIAIIVVIFAGIISLIAVFGSLVIASVAVAFAGVCVFIAGLVSLVPELAVGLALIGTGIILTVIGVVATVASVRLCIIVLPGICRGCVWILRKPFQRRAVV
ncbi:DUF1700 domain-containing protein [Sporofaciens musculi]|uniref:DUF1700 domain-containing protein n=1 Tax=Sporofaciens musculi TaxID=2681861 RepID=UPI00216E3BD9|nr:DUF1700 domain-containing protein [Sporofaciens musculi]MCI9423333.1 DUF1700 domain-containing protein [Dorea sp.]